MLTVSTTWSDFDNSASLTQYFCVFRMIFKENSFYFLKYHNQLIFVEAKATIKPKTISAADWFTFSVITNSLTLKMSLCLILREI